MRLQATNCFLKQILSELKINQTSSGEYTLIQNWKTIFKCLYDLYDYDFAKQHVQEIFDLGPNFKANIEPISIHNSQYGTFKNNFDLLVNKCKGISDFIDSLKITDEDSSNEINIKLPRIRDLQELSELTDKLDKIFNQCPLLTDYGHIQFKRVDVGSDWIVLCVQTAILASLTLMPLAQFVKCCVEVRKTLAETKKINIERQISELQLEKAQQENIIKQLKEKESKKLQNVCLQEAKKISEEKVSELKPDDVNRLVYSMTTLAELLEKGLEVYPSLQAPQEVREAFPKQELYPKLENQIKLLNSRNQQDDGDKK